MPKPRTIPEFENALELLTLELYKRKPPGLSMQEWNAWADCAIPGCANKSCLSLYSNLCHPHAIASKLESMTSSLHEKIKEHILLNALSNDQYHNELERAAAEMLDLIARARKE